MTVRVQRLVPARPQAEELWSILSFMMQYLKPGLQVFRDKKNPKLLNPCIHLGLEMPPLPAHTVLHKPFYPRTRYIFY